MASLPIELQKLPPQALDVIRYLATCEQGAYVDLILEGTGLSERAFGKAIRRLVTRYYVEMRGQGFYVLTASGKQAAQIIAEYDGGTPGAAPSAPSSTNAAPRHIRRLTVVTPQQLALGAPATLLAGFDAPAAGQPALKSPGRIILRLSAPGCDVEPVERPLEVVGERPAGPVRFNVQPRRDGTVRVKIEAFQLLNTRQVVLLGGTYFDLTISSAAAQAGKTQAFGVSIGLHINGAA